MAKHLVCVCICCNLPQSVQSVQCSCTARKSLRLEYNLTIAYKVEVDDEYVPQMNVCVKLFQKIVV